MKNISLGVAVLVFISISLFEPLFVAAQTPCGDIIAPESWFNLNSALVTTPIGDCADPFGVSAGVESPYILSVDGQTVEPSGTVTVAVGGTQNYEITGNPLLDSANHLFFLHDGDDYRFVNTSLSEPEEVDYRTLAQAFFPAGTDIEPYIETILSGDYYLEDDSMQEQLFGFLDYVDQNFVPQVPYLQAGTYTLVSKEYEIILTKQGLFKNFLARIVPTAYAVGEPVGRENVFSLTFTITETQPEPTGISNILFLPGMQGSRLYMEENGDEVQLWEPFGSEDYEKLRMTNAGVSVNDVYTRDVIDEIYGTVGNIYKSFIKFLDELDGDDGPLVQIFPYDWRYDVIDLIENGTQYESGLQKKLVETVDYLATLSDTEKVTIIAHSNGGLLAKALMIKLEELGKAGQVDKIIFIATPHIGTPKAVAALLHGYDQEQALNIPADARDIRKVIKNMSGPYGLLPSEAYISSLSEPLISFDNSTTTKLYRDSYGFTVSNMTEYRNFLNGAEGREEKLDVIELPTKTNNAILDDALEIHANVLDSWEAPEGIAVFNIVGTGLETPKSIEYREFVQDFCGSPTCVVKKLEPVVKFTLYGDETVVTRSSESVNADERIYIDLAAEEKYEHGNIMESGTVQDLVDALLHASSTEGIDYVSATEPVFTNSTTRVDRIHSPARIYIEDPNGRRTGRDSSNQEWKEEIPGTNYYEIGGVKYLLKPANLNHRVVIEGEGNGVFTHVVDELVNDQQTTLHTLVASVTPTTRVTYQYTNGTTSLVSVDQNGDGTTDHQLTLDGLLIDTKATYAELKTSVRNLKLARLKETPLLVIVEQAEQFYKKRTDTKNGKIYEKLEEDTLYLLDQTLIQLRKGKFITPEAYKGIKGIIDRLVKQ